MAQTIRQAQAELRKAKKQMAGAVEANCALLARVEGLEVANKHDRTKLFKAYGNVQTLTFQVDRLQADYDVCDTAYEEQRVENIRLIKKNEAMQSIMDSMAHLATAGQALIEL